MIGVAPERVILSQIVLFAGIGNVREDGAIVSLELGSRKGPVIETRGAVHHCLRAPRGGEPSIRAGDDVRVDPSFTRDALKLSKVVEGKVRSEVALLGQRIPVGPLRHLTHNSHVARRPLFGPRRRHAQSRGIVVGLQYSAHVDNSDFDVRVGAQCEGHASRGRAGSDDQGLHFSRPAIAPAPPKPIAAISAA